MNKKEPGYISFSDLSENEKTETLATIKHLFIARKDVYGEQWVNANGKQAYTKKEEVITDEILIAHLTGKKTIGIYQFAPNTENVKWGVLDIDGEHIDNAKIKIKELWARLVNTGIDSEAILIEESGSESSYHVWLFFAKPTNAKSLERFLKQIIKPIDPGIEVFPKQEQVREEKFGNLVKLPLGFHKAAKRWSHLFSQTGRGEGVTGFEALRHLKTCELPKVVALKKSGLRPCFKRAIDERWVLQGPEADVFRLALAGEMLTNDYSDEEMHSVFALQPNYNYEKTQEKLAYSKANGYHTWKCESITAQCSGLLAGMCDGCTRTSENETGALKEPPQGKTKKKGKGEKSLSLGDVLALPDYKNSGEIENIIVIKKSLGGLEQDFFISAKLVNGELEHELTDYRAIPPQTAPSLDFHTKEYGSLSKLYSELKSAICAYVAFTNDGIAPDLIALGSMASYFREVYYTYPYFDFISSEPEAGKTTAMKVQTFLSYYGTIASSVTEALLFREIDGSHCFYGLDNIERLFAAPKDNIGLIDWLLSSYSKDIPCKRLEKMDEDYRVRYFDGYGIKAFSHIQDFPYALRALRSRCIQIVMEKKKPKLSYPSAEKFTEMRDKLYKARLYEFDAVQKSYQKCIDSKDLTGRTGDLFYPLLAIAKLINLNLYDAVLKYARSDEGDRIELDSWNKLLIQVLVSENLIGSRSAKDIMPVLEDALRTEGLLKDSERLYARTVTMRLKKLGFEREDKKTDHKTWFIIDSEKLMLKAYEYNIINEEEVQKSINTHTPPKGTLCTLGTSGSDENTPKKGSVERGEEDKPSTGEIEPGIHEEDEEGSKGRKVPKRGVYESTKNVCDKCGGDGATELYKNSYYHPSCLAEIQHEEAKTTTRKTRSGISKGLDVEYEDLTKCNFTEAVK